MLDRALHAQASAADKKSRSSDVADLCVGMRKYVDISTGRILYVSENIDQNIARVIMLRCQARKLEVAYDQEHRRLAVFVPMFEMDASDDEVDENNE